MSIPIDVNDKHGRMIHINDIVRWIGGGKEPVLFSPCIENATLVFPCSHYDLSHKCEVIQTHDGVKVRS